jgi:hypothetical protein
MEFLLEAIAWVKTPEGMAASNRFDQITEYYQELPVS